MAYLNMVLQVALTTLKKRACFWARNTLPSTGLLRKNFNGL